MSKKLISYEELAKHNHKTDCWVAVKGQVLDVTHYLEQEPAEKEFLLANAGTDATHNFTEREKEGKKRYIQTLTEKLSIGNLDYDSPKVAPKNGNSIQRMYTYLEISKHNKSEDCWVIVHGGVYDVTKFLDEHPGGAAMIFDYAGKDATEPYVDYNHSSHATKLLSTFQVGVVDVHSKDEYLKLKSNQSKNIKILVGISFACLVAVFILYTLLFK